MEIAAPTLFDTEELALFPAVLPICGIFLPNTGQLLRNASFSDTSVSAPCGTCSPLHYGLNCYSASTQKISIQNLRLRCRSWELCPPLGVRRSAQGIGGAGPPQVAIGRGAGPQAMRCGGTPAKPGFRCSRKCAQMKFCKNLLYPLLFYK
jgi:hypothetical protein